MSTVEQKTEIRVLLIDDEEFFLKVTAETLSDLGCDVAGAKSGEEGLEKLAGAFFDVVVLDIQMPGMDGIEVLRKLQSDRPTQQVIMLSGRATVPKAIESMKLGAFDFLVKPCSVDDLMRVVSRAAERGHLERRNLVLQQELGRTRGPGRMIGESEAARKLHQFINMASKVDLPVLITGESGTGKELVARAIHDLSGRASNSLVVVDGSTVRDELLASELFGHERGAFTGAVRKKAGLFEVADRGSIFLDEIGELSPSNQAALLRVIEYGSFRPVGGVKEVHTDVRIIAATNKDIEKAITKGEFREDLYYRLRGLTITIPPLRERKSDILLIVQYYLARTGIELSGSAIEAVSSYDWPGNVRQLRYVIELAALSAAEDGEIRFDHLPAEIKGQSPQASTTAKAVSSDSGWSIHLGLEDLPLSKFRELCERTYIERLLARLEGNKSQVAKVLGVSRPMLYEKLHRWGIK